MVIVTVYFIGSAFGRTYQQYESFTVVGQYAGKGIFEGR